MIFSAGLFTGAAAALLFAPKSGRELRGDIATTANQLGNTVAEAMPALPEVDSLNPFNNSSNASAKRRPAQIEAK